MAHAGHDTVSPAFNLYDAQDDVQDAISNALTPRSVLFNSSMLPCSLALSSLAPTLLLRWLLTCLPFTM
eukprot:1153224-Pelagomonas_calceolata.AAC.5